MSTAAFDPHPTLGALEIGAFISILLFGILTVQVYLYYRHFLNDHAVLKAVVGFIWVCELGHALCITSGTYKATISFYGHPEKLVRIPDNINAAIIFGAFIDPVVQSVFIFRIYKLSHKLGIPILCWTIATALLVGGLVISVAAFATPSVKTFEAQYGDVLAVILTGGAILDIIIVVSLCYHLVKQRRNSFIRTVRVLDILVVWTIQTGLLTSVAAVASTICFFTMKKNYAWMAIFMDMTGLFSNSLLALLNGRTELCNIMNQDPHTSDIYFPGGLESSHHQSTIQQLSIDIHRGQDLDVTNISNGQSENDSKTPTIDEAFKVFLNQK